MNSSLVWLEIPANDFDQAVSFYESVLQIKTETRVLFDTRHALFTKDQLGMKGSIVELPGYKAGLGIKPIFYVDIMGDALERVKESGGSVFRQPTLLRQKNKNGQIIIGTNLIDGKVGYYSEIQDPEGNHLYLYSHS